MKLEEHRAYILSFELSNYIWDIMANGIIWLKTLLVNNLLDQLTLFPATSPRVGSVIIRKIKSSIISTLEDQ